ncbi:response regulator [Edaphobacter sp. HDX4]|uniref:response regulator n=1 Tax=Edaphobacter sp. HDX4 TaxID=2794064 RepID=UPI002FE6A9F0
MAATGEDAIGQISEQDFSLVIPGVMLPGINGFAVLQRIREETYVPVLMLTAPTISGVPQIAAAPGRRLRDSKLAACLYSGCSAISGGPRALPQRATSD